MTTNVRGNAAREYTTAQIHYLRFDWDYTMINNMEFPVGELPDNAVVLRVISSVNAPLNAGSANNLNLNLYDINGAPIGAPDVISVATSGQTIDPTIPNSTAAFVSTYAKVTAGFAYGGAPPTAGEGALLIEYAAKL